MTWNDMVDDFILFSHFLPSQLTISPSHYLSHNLPSHDDMIGVLMCVTLPFNCWEDMGKNEMVGDETDIRWWDGRLWNEIIDEI